MNEIIYIGPCLECDGTLVEWEDGSLSCSSFRGEYGPNLRKQS